MENSRINSKIEKLVKGVAEVSREIYQTDELVLNKHIYAWVNYHHSLFAIMKKDLPDLYHKHEPDINLFYSKEIVTDNIFHLN